MNIFLPGGGIWSEQIQQNEGTRLVRTMMLKLEDNVNQGVQFIDELRNLVKSNNFWIRTVDRHTH